MNCVFVIEVSIFSWKNRSPYFFFPMKLKKSFVSINIKRACINKEKLAKNSTIYQYLIVLGIRIFFFKEKIT